MNRPAVSNSPGQPSIYVWEETTTDPSPQCRMISSPSCATSQPQLFVCNERDELSSSESSVLLRSESKGIGRRTDAIATQLAKDLQATLISVDLDDFEDLGREFERQDEKNSQVDQKDSVQMLSNDPLNHYFAVPTRRKAENGDWERSHAAISAIVDASKTKCEFTVLVKAADIPTKSGGQSVNGCDGASPVLVYLRNVKRFTDISTKGYRILARLRESIQERRASGAKLVLLVDEPNKSKGSWSGRIKKIKKD